MKISILGAGSWGIALACHLHQQGHSVTLWARDPKKAEALASKREDPLRLPGFRILEGVAITPDAAKALDQVDWVVLAVPSNHLRNVLKQVSGVWPKGAPVVCATKGLEEATGLRMSQVIQEIFSSGDKTLVLSGPSHAEEVVKNLPTTLVMACQAPEWAQEAQNLFHSPAFRVYTSSDIVGVELGGALKNVIAIAAGISDGLGLGDNTKAALMTRGLHEMARLGLALGAEERTFAGLAGMGDLIVTCTSRHSRNRALGEKVGRGLGVKEALDEMVMVAEGVYASKAALKMAREKGVETPIIREVHDVLFEGKPAKEALKSLLSRSAKAEQDLS